MQKEKKKKKKNNNDMVKIIKQENEMNNRY